jgi:hypothetical protein
MSAKCHEQTSGEVRVGGARSTHTAASGKQALSVGRVTMDERAPIMIIDPGPGMRLRNIT